MAITVSFTGSAVELLELFQNNGFIDLIRKNDTAKTSLKQAIFEVTGKVYGIGPYKKAKPDTPSPLSQFEEKAKQLNINYTEK